VLSLAFVCCLFSRELAFPDRTAADGPAARSPSLAQSGSSAAGEARRAPTDSVGGRTSATETIAQRVPDSLLVDQDGKPVRFYTDLVRGKVVVVSFIFTSCNLVCPMLGNSFSKLQKTLADRLGRDIHLITVTTDPKTDTPERLREWSSKFGARRGWTLVTGDTKTVDELLIALTGTGSGQSEHSPGILIINDRTGALIREDGLGDGDKLIEVIDGTR
jgi:cytochrome oxidase Cu insertion factor (SCO1/SenC/PrrC family)